MNYGTRYLSVYANRIVSHNQTSLFNLALLWSLIGLNTFLHKMKYIITDDFN